MQIAIEAREAGFRLVEPEFLREHLEEALRILEEGMLRRRLVAEPLDVVVRGPGLSPETGASLSRADLHLEAQRLQ